MERGLQPFFAVEIAPGSEKQWLTVKPLGNDQSALNFSYCS